MNAQAKETELMIADGKTVPIDNELFDQLLFFFHKCAGQPVAVIFMMSQHLKEKSNS